MGLADPAAKRHRGGSSQLTWGLYVPVYRRNAQRASARGRACVRVVSLHDFQLDNLHVGLKTR
eukprot:7513564-Pyramimonas_sp.AAC.1